MHLYEKWSKYAFAYAHMQMHNYPKPSYLHESPFYLSQKTFFCALLMMMLITTAEFLLENDSFYGLF